jgi:hypothetical protein
MSATNHSPSSPSPTSVAKFKQIDIYLQASPIPNSLLPISDHVFIPFQAAATILLSFGSILPIDDCGIGDVVETLSFGATTYSFGVDYIVGIE